MTNRRLLLFAATLAMACSPSQLNLLPETDARAALDSVTSRPDSDDASDGGVASDVAAPMDVQAVDIVSADNSAAPDASSEADVPPVVDAADVPPVVDATDVPPVVDATDVPPVVDATDVPPAVDGGMCPTGMVFIPAGQFMMGDLLSGTEARPVHGVRLTEFCMDRTLVTVAAYQACVTAGVCEAPVSTGNCNLGVAGRERHPMNCANWAQARTYCQWQGGDLPTEARWEYAARGMEGRTFPWGEAVPNAQLCWSGAVGRSGTCPVSSFPEGDTPNGLSDMAGNALEWTLDWNGPYSVVAAGTYVLNPIGPTSGTSRIVRGGTWFTMEPIRVRAAYRTYNTPDQRSQYQGFRCVRGPS